MKPYKNRYFPWIGSLVLIALSSCATIGPSADQLHLDSAVTYADRGEWERAYSFVEGLFDSSNDALKSKAYGLIAKYPQIVSAGQANFTDQRLLALVTHYENRELGIAYAQHRVARFCLVAPAQDCSMAKRNMELVESGKAFEHQQAELERQRLEYERQQLELKNRQQREHQDRAAFSAKLDAAERDAVYLCRDKTQCDKAFALTQIYINQVADMKFQVTTDAILETFNPTDSTQLGMKAIRLPGRSTSSTITLSAYCKESLMAGSMSCHHKRLDAYVGFRPFIDNNLKE